MTVPVKRTRISDITFYGEVYGDTLQALTDAAAAHAHTAFGDDNANIVIDQLNITHAAIGRRVTYQATFTARRI